MYRSKATQIQIFVTVLIAVVSIVPVITWFIAKIWGAHFKEVFVSVFCFSFLIIPVGMIGLVIWLIYLYYWSPVPVLRRTRKVRIADAKDGEVVRIVGRLRPRGELLEAPFSRRRCAVYEAVVEEPPRRRDRTWYWTTIASARARCDFVVEDDSGYAIVETGNLEAAVVLDHHQFSALFHGMTPELEAFIQRHMVPTMRYDFRRWRSGMRPVVDWFGVDVPLRCREGVLEPGEQIAVCGRARWEDDPDEGGLVPSDRDSYRNTMRRKRMVIEAGPKGAVYVSDDPKALD